MKTFLKHMAGQPFILATGVAAFVHSTWGLATVFGGLEPVIASWADIPHYLGWMLPAAAISFALDVGQIYTASEIRAGERTWQKYATFALFSLFTYYFQWLYVFAHMPVIGNGAGVGDAQRMFALGFRDLALWIGPGLLPLLTFAYTFSSRSHTASEPERSLAVVQPAGDGLFKVACPDCEWTVEKPTQESAQNALNGHRRVHPGLALVSSNGHGR